MMSTYLFGVLIIVYAKFEHRPQEENESEKHGAQQVIREEMQHAD